MIRSSFWFVKMQKCEDVYICIEIEENKESHMKDGVIDEHSSR